MFSRLGAIPWRSIRVKLVLGLLCITLPMIALLIYNNHYSVNVIHNQVANSNKNLVSVNMRQIDDQLSEAERHMMGLLLSDINLIQMGEAYDDDQYMLAKSGVSRRLTSDLIVYPYIDGFFAYSVPRGDIVESYRNEMGYAELMNLRQSVEALVMAYTKLPNQLDTDWTVRKINGENYILRLFGDGAVYIGTWVKAKSMLEPLRLINTGEAGATLIVDNKGDPLYSTRNLTEEGLDFSRGFEQYYLSGTNEDYLVVGEPSRKGGFSLVAVVPDKIILENLPYLARATLIVVVVALFMLPLSLWLLRKILLLPLQKMTKTMRRIGDGNLHMQIEESSVPDEFQLVNRTFNQMIGQIEELKIHVYEEQLDKQSAELKHLQLQINPHFFMNALNILYNLAQVKQYELIQEMTMCLVQYFRYTLQNNHSLVLLKEEIQHVRNFLRIQQLRFPYLLTCDVQVPDYLLDTPIPSMLLQTFVENTIKHGVRIGEPLVLTIEASLDELAEEPMVIIVVSDTGEGFTDEALEKIRGGEQFTDEQGKHIGLWNARERLRLQYGERSWMHCYNDDPQGAVVEIGIPFRPDLFKKGE
ncbi:putative sensor-like histidine kinase [compost metagenome]